LVHRQIHEVVNAVVIQVIGEVARYYQAITVSVQTADEGLVFAGEAGEFCGRLARVNESSKDLEEGLKNMYQLAEKAHSGSLAMNEKFRAVRTNMFQVCVQVYPLLRLNDGSKSDYQDDTSLYEANRTRAINER
jgi:hypothetical protein